MWGHIVLPLLVGYHKLFQASAYLISTTLPVKYKRITNCRRCLQHLIPDATFSLAKRDGSYGGTVQKDVLMLYAHIHDDIPFKYVDRSCFDKKEACFWKSLNLERRQKIRNCSI
ncbi:unnamed protein product [Albugo candida]|uniref:Uncharacterized protein n=1 Tax=Albugo candida TaxID=65357 RepID=A0A024FU48_9STRA|nr:unnamed protein product [Albugo candida]|eukprot:CCI10650.1 unnamed protein product [Albugo candida]